MGPYGALGDSYGVLRVTMGRYGALWGRTCMICVTGPDDACPVTADVCTGLV